MATGAYPTGTMTNTTLANIIPSVWTDKINNFFRSELVTAKFFTDLSSELSGGGRYFQIPNVSEMTAHAKANATAVTVNNLTDSNISLEVNTWYETSFSIEKREAKQVKQSYGIQEMYARNAAHTTAKVLETAIIDLFAGFSQIVGASNAAVADSDIRRAIQYLDEAEAPASDRVFFFDPATAWNDVMAIDRFTLVDNTPQGDPVGKGVFGMLYGIPVYINQNIRTAGLSAGSPKNALAHKDAIVHAEGFIDVDTNYIPQYLSWLTTADIMFGVIENRDTSGVWIKAAS